MPTIEKDRYSDLHSISKEEWDILWNDGILEETDSKGANDWVKLYPKGVKDLKYSIKMYSPTLNKLRHRTMSEFYGGGIVD